MEKDLHKRLEEAAEAFYEDYCLRDTSTGYDAYIAGAEHGYKEAIAQFREFLENKVKALQEENRIWRNSNLGSQVIILQRCIEEYFREK